MSGHICNWACNCPECDLGRRVALDEIKDRIHHGPDTVMLCGKSHETFALEQHDAERKSDD